MSVIRQYFALIRKLWKDVKVIFFIYTAFMFLGSIMPTIAAYTQQLFINSLEKELILPYVIFFLILFVMIKFFQSIYQYVDSYWAHKFIYSVKFDLKKYLMKKLYKEHHEKLYMPTFNDLLDKVNQGIEIAPFQIFEINGMLVNIIVLIFVQIPLIITKSPSMLLLVLVDSLLSLLTTRKLSRVEYELEQSMTREKRKVKYFGNVFSSKPNAKEIRIFGAQKFIYNNWRDHFRFLNRTQNLFQIKKQLILAIISIWNFVINNMLLIILFYQLLKGDIDLGTFTFLYILVPSLSEQFKGLIQSMLGDLYKNYLTIEHYIKYIDEEIHENGAEGNLKNFQTLEIKNVSYKYPNGKHWAVDNVSLFVKRGEIISILGYNGSGKSTLSKLMIGLMSPSEGSILINGKENHEYRKSDVYSLFGMAYQDFTKYLLSVNDNIGFGFIEKYNDENINKALQKAECDNLLKKLPNGLETKLGKTFYSDGVDLSGGEWQKIDLARTYMGDHCVLIMDEPTASIDPLKEIDMLKHFRTILEGRTAILISHRIGFARLADRIIIMNEGKIEESGSHEELLRKDGLYAKLFNSQKKLYI